MNREKAIRDGFYTALKGLITYNGNGVNIYDSATVPADNELLYILLTNQSGVRFPDDQKFRWQCTQTLEIVSKQLGSVAKDIVDEVSEQIENRILYTTDKPGWNGMVEQTGWYFRNLDLETINYTDFELSTNYWEITKIIQFNILITKN